MNLLILGQVFMILIPLLLMVMLIVLRSLRCRIIRCLVWMRKILYIFYFCDIMKKSLIYNFSHASRMADIEMNSVIIMEDEHERLASHDPKDSFLRIVYAVDSRTKVPNGDLQYLVSDKVNPEVRDWILRNLLVDVSASAFRSQVRGLSDDDIAVLAKQPSETIQDYAARVNDFMRDNASAYERLGKAYLASSDQGRNVSSRSE